MQAERRPKKIRTNLTVNPYVYATAERLAAQTAESVSGMVERLMREEIARHGWRVHPSQFPNGSTTKTKKKSSA